MNRNFVALAAAAAVASGFFFVEDTPDVTAEIAIEAALDQFRQVESAPKPGVCGNCNGTGKVGDTRVMYDCPVCNGTGKTECISCQIP